MSEQTLHYVVLYGSLVGAILTTAFATYLLWVALTA